MEERKKIFIFKIVVGSILGLAIIVAVIMAITLGRANALLKPISEQLSLLETGQVESAYNLISEHFKDQVNLKEFTDFVEANPVLTAENEPSFNRKIIQGERGLAIGLLTGKDGDILYIKYNLIKENKQWRILHLQVSQTSF